MQRYLGGPDKCWINQVPGAWFSQKPPMNALQYNEYPSKEAERVSIAGRMGTFEVYGNLGAPQSKNIIIHLFSKQRSGLWPHFASVANRANRGMDDSAQGASAQQLENDYTTRTMTMQGQPEEQKSGQGRSQIGARSTS